MTTKDAKGAEGQQNWDTAALIRYLDGVRLRLGKDQRTFLEDAGIAGSWLSNLKADAARGPALSVLMKLRKTYGIDIDTATDILERNVTVDEGGRIRW